MLNGLLRKTKAHQGFIVCLPDFSREIPTLDQSTISVYTPLVVPQKITLLLVMGKSVETINSLKHNPFFSW